MRNIHILETDRPTRLYLPWKEGRNIFITNDEEIQEGDWFIGDNINLRKCTLNNAGNINFKGGWYSGSTNCRKIILTTDKVLIKDGVQSIDDEFLEWFVKNPSCEKVKVDKEYVTPLGDVVETCYDNERLNYKIIIPKQETLEEASNNYINSDKTPNDYESFIEGAKWQQERMYSETEVESLLQRFRLYSYNHGCGNAEFEEWFNELKKK